MKCAFLCCVLFLTLLHATWGNEACSSPKPDFKAQGRRISEERCREYNWEKKCSSQDGDVNKYPYMGAIAYTKEKEVKFLCNAVLISPKFAVTAAYCAKGLRENIPEFVRFGNKNLKDVPVTDAKIVKTFIHPEFAAPKKSFDIALMEFERALPVSRAVAPACLWTQPEITTNQDILLPAWAVMEKDLTNLSNDILRTMTVQAIDSETCAPLIQRFISRNFKKLLDHQLCVNESDSVNYFRHGSSGAPIVTSVPLGEGDEMPYVQAFATYGLPKNVGIGIYVKISNFVDWIEQTAWS